MDLDVADSAAVPRFVDIALLLCGEALRLGRKDLQQAPSSSSLPSTSSLYGWYLHKICYLHELPNDHEGDLNDEALDVTTPYVGVTASAGVSHVEPAAALHALRGEGVDSDLWRSLSIPLSRDALQEVSFRRAYSQLRPPGKSSLASEINAVLPSVAEAHSEPGRAPSVGQVHQRSPLQSFAEWGGRMAHGLSGTEDLPQDVGFQLIHEFLRTSMQVGGVALAQRLATLLRSSVTMAAQLRGDKRASPLPITVAQLSALFQEDLLDDELGSEAGNATRSFYIWLNYEWASASFVRQARLAALITRWLTVLQSIQNEDGHAFSSFLEERHSFRARARLPPSPSLCAPPQLPSALATVPLNVRRMFAALRGVFEGDAITRNTTLMELSLGPHMPHLSDNALAKLLFLQGPPTSSIVSRSELNNRGTQPTLMCITTGMLLYAHYYLSFRSLPVASQCVRVALQVAQELPSNIILALAHYTAHVIATHQGKPDEAANSITIALQLTLPNGGRGAHEESPPLLPAPQDGAAEVQMASLSFIGAAQLLIFFPGAVGPALRSLLTTGQSLGEDSDIAGSRVAGEDPRAVAGETAVVAEDVQDGTGRYSGAVAVQTVAQSVRHALLRGETAMLRAPPTEGRWLGVVAYMQRETLLLMGSVYGMVSSPMIITKASLGELLREVEIEISVASPLYSYHPRRMLLWEVIRHSAHHALALEEGFLSPEKYPTGDREGRDACGDPLQLLRTTLDAITALYGTSGLTAAKDNVFFSSVVRYCVGCRLHRFGCVKAAYQLWTGVVAVLRHTSGAEETDTTYKRSMTGVAAVNTTSPRSEASSLTSSSARYWPPDHLLLYTLALWRCGQAATFLALVDVPLQHQHDLLSVSASFSFPFGVLTAQLMEAHVHQSQGRISSAISAARHVERAATRIGYPNLSEAARELQVTGYGRRASWRAAQKVLRCCRPLHRSQKMFVLLQQYHSQWEVLLAQCPLPLKAMSSLARAWVAVLVREHILIEEAHSLRVCADACVSPVEELCLYSALQRTYSVLGYDATRLALQVKLCLETIVERQSRAMPDLYVHGSCEELCEDALKNYS